jgi:beta-1,4-mannosyl-glycoprotein beta-1,4-N-acetylglucosaminyltransferase
MNKSKIFDCVTFFNENLLVNARLEILKDVVDYFVICESNYDYRGHKKKINFRLINKKFRNRVRHLILTDKFPDPKNLWKSEEHQREMIFEGIKDAKADDFIMYSDSDEIPNPEIIKKIKFNKKYGIFMMNMYVYKINLFNQYESPWEGTRICKKKDLKSFSFLRKKILAKNLKKNFFRKLLLEKDIELIKNGGWHFNNLYEPEIISKKLKSFPHSEFSDKKFSSTKIIKEKIKMHIDLFNRGHIYKVKKIDNSYPRFIFNNLKLFKNYIELLN